ncbi:MULTISPECIES: sensor histidine kinase KdpD [unclassified Synechocystis]|uniref:sensor histidine kinase n=1 Tax=unclassified Synechocystis TaxID=2640012 RepID=UPI000427C66D|nr:MULTISPECIES: HAMP domain-containing sensor histidine kinase [unclassified Synechocystis]AIE75446.1 Histidine Kinase [Synechocystis sp. PCC 6714]MCT0253667.1 HAMP domain-containing histidine kinase [Synechocystis sp. CS-94]
MFRLVQGQAPHTLHTLGTAAAVHWFKNICLILADNQIECTLWAKFGVQSPWQKAIADYGQTGLLRQIYWCRTGENPGLGESLKLDQSIGITPLLLEVNTHWQGENFFCFLSSQINLLILLGESPENPKVVNILQSFSPRVIGYFLNELKQSLVVADDLSVDLFTPEELNPSADLDLVNQLVQGMGPQLKNSSTAVPQSNSSAIANSFVVNLIRELGIPLTNIKTALQLLESLQQKKEARQRYLDLIKQNCDRQMSLITGLQELLTIEATTAPLESVQIADCTLSTIGIYQPIALEKSIILNSVVAENCPPVACTGADLRTILQRLLENALKFTNPGGRVQIKAYHQGPQVEIVVSDNGCGIAMADIPHLFDCFFQGQNALPETQGAGLGLTIVQSLVQRWGGKITVRSRPGQGSNFHVFLPVMVDHSLGHRFIVPS